MPIVTVPIPETPREILASRNARFVCPKCDGNNYDPSSLGQSLATSPFAKFLAKRTCFYCSWSGDVSFAELLAVNTSDDYIDSLFQLVQTELAAGTSQAFKTAEDLIRLLQAVHKASKKAGEQSHPWATLRFHLRLRKASDVLKVHRKEAFDKDMAKAAEATDHLLSDLVCRTAEGCDLRRSALDAQREIEDKFEQRY